MFANRPFVSFVCGLSLFVSGCQSTTQPTDRATRLTASVLPADPRVVTNLAVSDAKTAQAVFDLPTLIAVAQNNNPATRAAWQRATEAAQAVNLVEASYLPRISAEILAGGSRGSTAGINDPLGLLPEGTVRTNTEGAAALISVQWLLFDFGVRRATQTAANELSFAADVGVSGVHQTLIHDVTQGYYNLVAAEAREREQKRRLTASQEIAAMSKARLERQLATIVETAQANQFVAQAQFDYTRAQSETRAASQNLAALAGLPLGARIASKNDAALHFPKAPPAQLDAFLQNALQHRPDLQAAFARARASRASVDAVEALFRPKILASVSAGRSFLEGSIADSRIAPVLGDLSGRGEHNVAGIFLGISIPLWDGNAAKYRREAAEAGAQAAQAEAEALRQLAQGEIIAAYEALKAALAANVAAQKLINTAQTTYDSARAMGEQGLLTIAEIDTALKAVSDAKIAQIEAQHSARSAAALLAYSTGRIAN